MPEDPLIDKKLELIAQAESGNKNILNTEYGKLTPEGLEQTANGYWQITDTNWRKIAPQLGIDAPYAMAAERDDQKKVARHLLTETPLGIHNWKAYNDDPKLRKEIAALEGDMADQGTPSQLMDLGKMSRDQILELVKNNPEKYPIAYKKFFPQAATKPTETPKKPAEAPKKSGLTVQAPPDKEKLKAESMRGKSVFDRPAEPDELPIPGVWPGLQQMTRGISEGGRDWRDRLSDIMEGTVKLATPFSAAALAPTAEGLSVAGIPGALRASIPLAKGVIGGTGGATLGGAFSDDPKTQRLGRNIGGITGATAGPFVRAPGLPKFGGTAGLKTPSPTPAPETPAPEAPVSSDRGSIFSSIGSLANNPRFRSAVGGFSPRIKNILDFALPIKPGEGAAPTGTVKPPNIDPDEFLHSRAFNEDQYVNYQTTRGGMSQEEARAALANAKIKSANQTAAEAEKTRQATEKDKIQIARERDRQAAERDRAAMASIMQAKRGPQITPHTPQMMTPVSTTLPEGVTINQPPQGNVAPINVPENAGGIVPTAPTGAVGTPSAAASAVPTATVRPFGQPAQGPTHTRPLEPITGPVPTATPIKPMPPTPFQDRAGAIARLAVKFGKTPSLNLVTNKAAAAPWVKELGFEMTRAQIMEAKGIYKRLTEPAE